MVEVFDTNNIILEITEAAAKNFINHLSKDTTNIGIYLGTKLMGCSGLAYDINFVAKKPANTIEINQQELRFFLSNKSIDYLNGMKIDYVRHDFGLYKLEYTNPNEAARCGCGESFTI